MRPPIRRSGLIVVLGLAAATGLALLADLTADKGRDPPRASGPPAGGDATPVLTAVAERRDWPVYVEGVGTGKALNSVLIRSQVDGTLMSLKFAEGQTVKAGDLVAKIDPRIYQATLDQDVAKKQLDEATLANNLRDLDRYKQLVATKAVTQQQYDTQLAAVAQAKAQIAIDQATIDSARTTLSYTDIRSPITGRTGIRNVDVGNLIHASDATGIVTVSQIQPISVIFNVPQQDLPRINEANLLNTLDVQALDPTGRVPPDEGVLTVVDNTIDATTGTVRLKADFDNPKLHLWPGIFVNMRLRVETLRDAVTVPAQAVQQGPKGAFVFVVEDGKAKETRVTLGQQDGTRAVIAAGLGAGQVVIVSGFQKLRNGGIVKPEPMPPSDSDGRATDVHEAAAVGRAGMSKDAGRATHGPPE